LSLSKFDLVDQVVIVTGGSKGIGRELVLGLAEAGANVTIVSRNQEQCEVVADEVRKLGRKALALSADVSEVSEAKRVVDETVRILGQLDVLINNAGINSIVEALNVTEGDWDRVIDVNLKAVFFWAQAAARVMKDNGGGKIVNIASVGGVIGENKMASYAASKAGVISLTKSLAREWGRFNILVNSLAPGYVRTEMNQEALGEEHIYKSIVSTIPLRRIGEAEDLVGPAIFLASSASNFITGHTLFVDGGRLTGTKG